MRILFCYSDKKVEQGVPPMGVKFILNDGNTFLVTEQEGCLSINKMAGRRDFTLSILPKVSNHILIK